MKFALIFGMTTLTCVGLFFFAKYSRRKKLPEKTNTLAGMYADFFRELPTLNSKNATAYLPLVLTGMFSSFYPVLLVLILGLGGQDWVSKARYFVFFPGIISLLGVVVNVLVMMLSQLSFGFGMGRPKRNDTAFFWVIPIFHGVFAVLGIVAGASETVAEWIYRVIS